MLHIDNLTVAYTATPVFQNLSVAFSPGKITGIIGPNGAGKSTLIKGRLDWYVVRGAHQSIVGQLKWYVVKLRMLSNVRRWI